MDILNSLYISVFGMSVVFVVLVSLILLINLQTFVAGKISGRSKVKGNVAIVSVDVAFASIPDMGTAAKNHMVVVSPGTQELKLTGVDDKTSAIIMAIVCDEIGVAPDQLYFKSIRALDEGANL